MTPDTADHPTQLGNYDVLEKIAEGGMGTVYKARHRYTGDVVAVKVIAPGTIRSPVNMQRFEREFTAARVLDHPNVVRALEYCGSGPHPFLVMEYVDGESLGQRIERDGAVPEAEAVRLIAQVCDGLQRAHKQGLVHRDVKPDNILVTRDGVAKLTDLGLVKEVEDNLNLTKTGRGLGTPHYMAPEQFRNAKGVDIRGDVYSLGATLYALVTGEVPFGNANPLDCWMKKIRNEFPPPKDVNPAVSSRVDWAIRRAMSAEPTQRPAGCREFVEDLTGQSRPTPATTTAPAIRSELWYMVYRDETGQTHTVKGGTDGIRGALRDGLLGDASTILVGRTKTGQFFPIGSIPEFRDLVVAPAPLSPSGRFGSGIRTPAGTRVLSDGAVDLEVSPPVGEPGGDPAALDTPAPGGSSARRSGVSAPPPGRGTPLTRPYPALGGSGLAARPAPRPATTASTPIPEAETLDFGPPSRTPAPVPVPPPRATTPGAYAPGSAADRGRKPGKAFDWSPILLVLVALVSGLVGYYLFMR